MLLNVAFNNCLVISRRLMGKLAVLLVHLSWHQSWWAIPPFATMLLALFSKDASPEVCFNPFPHIDAFWRLFSRRIFENIVTKEEIAQNVQFLLLSQCFPLLVIGYPFHYRNFPLFVKICSKSSAAELQTAFWKHSDKRINCTKRAISPFATMFSTFSHRLSIQL